MERINPERDQYGWMICGVMVMKMILDSVTSSLGERTDVAILAMQDCHVVSASKSMNFTSKLTDFFLQ